MAGDDAADGAGPAGGRVRRKVDELGRVVIPSAMRRALGIGEGDLVEFSVDGERLVVAPAADRCTFCGGDRHLSRYRERPVCWSCLAALRALAREQAGEDAPDPAAPFDFE